MNSTNIEIKKAVKAGNSSSVILPRAWLHKEVRIELLERTPESVLLDVLNIIKNKIPLIDIIGIYLVGSYARGEETEDSDIDILVVTKHINEPEIKEGIYSITIASKKIIEKKLETNLFPIGQMLKEAKPLLNSDYLSSINIQVTKNNINWYLKTTKEKLELIKASLQKIKKIDPRIIYTLILRIKTLYIIEKLISNKNYSGKEFRDLIDKIAGKNAYASYLSVKNNSEEKSLCLKEEAEKLASYLEMQLREVWERV